MWTLALGLQLWLWYHHGIDSTITHVPSLSAEVGMNSFEDEWL